MSVYCEHVHGYNPELDIDMFTALAEECCKHAVRHLGWYRKHLGWYRQLCHLAEAKFSLHTGPVSGASAGQVRPPRGVGKGVEREEEVREEDTPFQGVWRAERGWAHGQASPKRGNGDSSARS